MAQRRDNGGLDKRSLEAFFELLRSGLWGHDADPSLFDGHTDWQAIFGMSKKQTVAGLVFDGITTLPVGMQPSKELLREWYVLVVKIERTHFLLNDVLVELSGLYRENGFNPVLLKGQGIAQCYRNPLRRQCGDIDLYIGAGDYERATRFAESAGLIGGRRLESEKHLHFTYRGVAIENHQYVVILDIPRRRRYFSKMVNDWYPHRCRTITLNDTPIALPPADFDMVYIFVHAVHHFFTGGIGLRQLCDWARVLHTFGNDIDIERLRMDIGGLEFDAIWKAFGCIAVDYLGLPEEQFPFFDRTYSEKGDKSVNIILGDGNFGFAGKGERPRGYFSGKWHSLTMNALRWGLVRSVFPRESVIYFGYYITMGITQIIKDKF